MMTFVLGIKHAVLAVQQFTPLSQQQPAEAISAPPLILAAYSFVWAAVFVYVWMLWRRLGKVERELAEVNAKLTKRARV